FEACEEFHQLGYVDQQAVMAFLAELFASAYIRIIALRAKRDEDNAPAEALAPWCYPTI
ncbi:hypothetical protein FGB62_286g00, partial [Gracilaria domingensis]